MDESERGIVECHHRRRLEDVEGPTDDFSLPSLLLEPKRRRPADAQTAQQRIKLILLVVCLLLLRLPSLLVLRDFAFLQPRPCSHDANLDRPQTLGSLNDRPDVRLADVTMLGAGWLEDDGGSRADRARRGVERRRSVDGG